VRRRVTTSWETRRKIEGRSTRNYSTRSLNSSLLSTKIRERWRVRIRMRTRPVLRGRSRRWKTRRKKEGRMRGRPRRTKRG
jgi:hypothetical protein